MSTDPAATIERFLRVLFQPSDVFEIRAPKCSDESGRSTHTVSGYFDFDSIATAAALAAALDASGRAPGIYVTLNPVSPALLARAPNRLCEQARETTRDHEIVARRWLLVDADPVRAAGTSASDAELEAARERCEQLDSGLRSRGWPEPIVALSGNGGHLLYRIDLSTDDGGLVKSALVALDARWSDAAVTIDRSVHNASRISKLLGTVARKGEPSADRPHRRSELLYAPPELRAVSREQLVLFAAPAPHSGAAAPTPHAVSNVLSGQRNSALTSLAGAMRRVGLNGGAIAGVLEAVNVKCCAPPLDAREVQSIARSIARYAPHSDGAPDPPAIRSYGELVRTFPKLREPTIDGLLRRGETMNVIAPPKLGKSWLVNDLALAVAIGRLWLGQFVTTRSKVLLVDNELHGETSANRIPRVAEARGVSAAAFDDHLFVVNVRGRLQDIYSLDRILNQHPPGTFGLVVLDAFYRFLPRETNENDNGAMANIYNRIDALADEFGCSFILIHHASKGNQSGKAITDVGAGAGSQSRAADTHLVLRPHEEQGAVVLDATPRSWPPVQSIALRWRFPVWTPAPDLDVSRLKSEKPKRGRDEANLAEDAVADFVTRHLTDQGQTRSAILVATKRAGLSERATKRLLQTAEELELAHRWNYGSHKPLRFATIPKPKPEQESERDDK